MGGYPSIPEVTLSRDRIVIVTGSNTGLGYVIAKRIAMLGATVILACRSEERAKNAMKRMNEEYQADRSAGLKGIVDYDTLSLEFMKLDLNSFQSVVEFCETFRRSGRPLHVLFCNAGIAGQKYAKTDDGYEICLQVNYLSHFLLTAKLLPIMKQSGNDCRILNMSSSVHGMAKFDMNTINYDGPPDKYAHMDYYARSKLYQIMQMNSMVRHKSAGDITVACINPGMTATDVLRDPQGAFKCMGCMMMNCCCCCMKSSEDGAKRSIDCAVNPELAGVTGIYYIGAGRKTPSSDARDVSKQDQLLQYSFEAVSKYMTEEEIAGMKGT